MADQGIQLPGLGGGLMRYSEEYRSKFMLKPSHVIIFIILILVLVLGLKIFMPISA